MRKKNLKFIFLIAFVILISVSPIVISKIEIGRLKSEIFIINSYIKNNKANRINTNLINQNMSIMNKKLENDVEAYLKQVINITAYINNIDNNKTYHNILSIDNIDKINPTSLNYSLDNLKYNLEKIQIKLNELDTLKNNSDYKDLVKDVDISNYKNLINDNLSKIDNYQKILINLLNDSNYKIENGELIFTKRNTYNKFQALINEINNTSLNIFAYQLINDQSAPSINASNITIYEGNNINLKKQIQCIDDIDGEIECEISGSYDKNTVGVYPIYIKATDQAGFTSEKTINVNVIEKAKLKYYTEIIRNHNTIIVYELDENGQYTKIAKVFACSTGRNGRTPTGVFYTSKGAAWGSLMGGVWGQYYTHITSSILIHSVPYYTKSKDNLEWQEYNKLGNEASAGCIRVNVRDAKWIFDNCPSGMKVKIYDGELPAGIQKPASIRIDENSPYRGWDPTDPDINNPWNQN